MMAWLRGARELGVVGRVIWVAGDDVFVIFRVNVTGTSLSSFWFFRLLVLSLTDAILHRLQLSNYVVVMIFTRCF